MLLQAEGLFKAFNDTIVLNDISINVECGEVVSLVGQSGAGKTTVLRCITGLEKCDRGSIAINNKYICKTENGITTYATKNELAIIRHELGMVFQSYHLFPHMTVLENVTLALTDVYKVMPTEANEEAVKMLESLGLGEKIDSKPSQLSGGQKQRVAIARSCVTKPKLLCFDEPTAALDSALVVEMVKIIRSLAREKGIGILIISHDEKFVRDVSDRVLFIEHGKITREMTSEEYKSVIRD
ncbi:MAG TPA: polar amino acid ABC transporter ATP-binding protein [Lachnospiraceae bacterium]|nr:polar amino acid ABC transporter ATP-binding protein [Lachnospiraceae bacterium]